VPSFFPHGLSSFAASIVRGAPDKFSLANPIIPPHSENQRRFAPMVDWNHPEIQTGFHSESVISFGGIPT
jgi:hypothetical protein